MTMDENGTPDGTGEEMSGRIKKTARVAYMGVRVSEKFKDQCLKLAADLMKMRGGRRHVTLGELFEVMADAYSALGKLDAKDRELLEKIAAKLKIETNEVIGLLLTLKAKELRLVE
jgi:hypothetical protein